MREVTSPIIATALVLIAVFVPTAFISGLTGQFYKQFALTIAISTAISAFNSLTLSPALAAVLLQPARHAAGSAAARHRRGVRLGAEPVQSLLRASRASLRRRHGPRAAPRGLSRSRCTRGLARARRGSASRRVPHGFIPQQDKQYLVAFAQLPEAATLDRTEASSGTWKRSRSRSAGVTHTVSFAGLSVNGLVNSPNTGIVFVVLNDFSHGAKQRTRSAGTSRPR